MMEKDYRASKVKSRISWVLACILAVSAAVVAIAPFIFMVINSFKEKFEMLTKGGFSLPEKLDISNYKEVIEGNFLSYFINSVIVLAVSLFILLMLSAFAAYPLSRFKFKLKGVIYSLIVACMSIPVHITLIPIFKMSQGMHMYDSIWALIGPYVAMGIPISVFILTSFMEQIPKGIEEAAAIDGCGKTRMFFSIILPMAKPGLSTLTQSQGNRTLPLAVWEFQGQYSMNTPMIMSVLTLTVLPMILLFIFAQDKLIKGMAAGAVKG